jgi:hypothetical protein
MGVSTIHPAFFTGIPSFILLRSSSVKAFCMVKNSYIFRALPDVSRNIGVFDAVRGLCHEQASVLQN